MRNFIGSRVVLWVVFFFVFNLIGCGGGGGDGSDTVGRNTIDQTADLHDQLTNFNLAMDWFAEDLVAQMETLDQLNNALAADDGSPEKTFKTGSLVDLFGLDSDMLLIDVEAMDLAEAGIQRITNSESNQSHAIIAGVVGVGLLIKGLYSFGQAMKGYSDDMTEARKVRDEAAEKLMNGVEGAEKEFNDAKKEMTDIGTEATREFATKVTTELVLSPINPTSTTGVILKDAAGNKLQKGMKVISATEECEGGYDSSGCKLGVSETDEADSAVVPEGNTIIVIGGKDLARTILKEEIPPGAFTEITVDPIPIEEATGQLIADSDNAATGDDDSGDTDPDDGDPPATPTMTLSAAVSSENSSSITYSVAAAVSGVTDSTTLTITVENASTGTSTKTLTADGTVVWSVIVLEEDAYVTVRRSDTGDQESLTLSAKSYDGTYVGMVSVTYNPEGFCSGGELSVEVSGSSISGNIGTIVGNAVSFTTGDWVYSGTIANNVMSGTWQDTVDPCSGTFSFTKQ